MTPLSQSDKNKMLAARELLRERRYAEAISLLQGIDHPKAHEWLQRINSDITGLSSGEINKMLAAGEFIREKRYVEAKSLLQGINHPIADHWLQRINDISTANEIHAEANRMLEEISAAQSPPTLPAPPLQPHPIVPHTTYSPPIANDQTFNYIVSMFVRDHWLVVAQSGGQASLEKPITSKWLAILLGAIALFILIFYSILLGVLCIGVSLLLIALNNATKRRGTVHLSALPDGGVRVVSNRRSLNSIYAYGYRGSVKT
jgi:hypothetical protein